jgi:hypothetical protein
MTDYHNPVQRAGDFADPFVLRHDGVYYLYCTNPDVRCWSSRDLVEWQLEGPTIDDGAFPGLVPFAPEVVYSNGGFYMYTSPSGHGHFVLRSESPTGPFRVVSGNVGHAIDGNVLIDDDGRWYFYWAGDEGIWGCEMPSPTEFGEPVLTGIHMNGWTEGPFVSKRDGIYWMTLTGNHYLSPGYRIDAAYSTSPLSGFQPDPLNPILIGADGPNVGLGHSSSVTGPDLVSTYLIYHNLNPDETRDLDIDRQVWSGGRLQVLGPTTSAPVPSGPDATGTAFWPTELPARFTAELNLTAGDGDYGISLGDALELRVDAAAGTVSAGALGSSALPADYVHGALHCWRLVRDGDELRLFIDGRAQLSVRDAPAAASRITLFGSVSAGHVALTGTTAERADRQAAKPVPGRFWAELGTGDSEREAEGVRLGPGTEIAYDLHVQQPGPAGIYLAGEFAPGDAIVLELDGLRHDLRADRLSVPVRLEVGTCRLTLLGAAGEPLVRLITVAMRPEPSAAAAHDETASGTGKRLLAGPYDDAVITAHVSIGLAPQGHADLIFRASQLSEGGEGDDTVLGRNFLLGYSVQLHHDRVVLARHDYDERILAEHPTPVDPLRPHVIVVRAVGGSIGVELDGTALFQVADDLPHPIGSVGIRTDNAVLRVERLRVEPL